jgi:pyruvate dehydrogenase E2 component (dihydrolipoamide acetyltransferase)
MMADSDVFLLPDLGEGLTEAEIVTWHVSVGDRVVAGQPLVSVETDKAVVEIPAPRSGVIGALHAAAGDRVAVGAALVTFGEPGAAATGVVGRLAEAPASTVPVEPGQTSGAAAPAAGAHPPPRPRSDGPASGTPVRAAPAVRQLARELGVELQTVRGSGPEGVVVSADVRAAAAGGAGAATAVGQAQPPRDARRVHPVRGPRRAMAERMADAHARVVPATVTGEADIQAWGQGTRPLPRLIRAVAVAAGAVPRLNAAFDDQRWELRERAAVDLGIAMETDDGLFVPVLRDVGTRTAAALAAELDELETAVRARTVAPDRLRGATITLSNFGAVGGWHAAMVVVPPQVAIVGAGRAAPRPVADGDRTVVHRVLPVSLTIDHRVITGIEACRFLAALIDDLETSQ